jgi:hypothetical protein
MFCMPVVYYFVEILESLVPASASWTLDSDSEPNSPLGSVATPLHTCFPPGTMWGNKLDMIFHHSSMPFELKCHFWQY